MEETENHEALVKALKEALTDNSPNGWALLNRVPLICNDIRDIKNDMRWMKYLGGGFVLAAGLLALKALGIVN